MNSNKIPITQQVYIFKCNYVHNKKNTCNEYIYDYNRSLHYCTSCIMKYGLCKYYNIFIKCDTCKTFYLKHYSYNNCAKCSYYQNEDSNIDSIYREFKNEIKENELKMTDINNEYIKDQEEKNFLNYLVSPILSYDFYNIKPDFFNPKNVEELKYQSAIFSSDIDFEMFRHQMI